MKKNDLLLLAGIIGVILLSFLVMGLLKKDGAYVTVRVDGTETARYSLSEDGEYSLNGGTNVLRIENGKAYMLTADCPDHLCVQQGKISRVTEDRAISLAELGEELKSLTKPLVVCIMY